MDIYGALQICTIGIIAAPITIKLFPTYVHNLGKTTICMWAGLVLAGKWHVAFIVKLNHYLRLKLGGLSSLTLEFFRVNTSDCMYDDSGKPISLQAREFPYGNATCGLICSIDQGPYSPIRSGSANNIYVIPAPDIITFDRAMLIAPVCSIPAMYLLIHVWSRVNEWKLLFGSRDEDLSSESSKGATLAQTRKINARVGRRLWHSAEILFFVALELSVLIFGELNFFSAQVYWQTEPMPSIGRLLHRPCL
jgi:hypothetical protein